MLFNPHLPDQVLTSGSIIISQARCSSLSSFSTSNEWSTPQKENPEHVGNMASLITIGFEPVQNFGSQRADNLIMDVFDPNQAPQAPDNPPKPKLSLI